MAKPILGEVQCNPTAWTRRKRSKANLFCVVTSGAITARSAIIKRQMPHNYSSGCLAVSRQAVRSALRLWRHCQLQVERTRQIDIQKNKNLLKRGRSHVLSLEKDRNTTLYLISKHSKKKNEKGRLLPIQTSKRCSQSCNNQTGNFAKNSTCE